MTDYKTPPLMIAVEGSAREKCIALLKPGETHDDLPTTLVGDERLMHLAGKPYVTFTWRNVVVATIRYQPTEADIKAAQQFFEDMAKLHGGRADGS